MPANAAKWLCIEENSIQQKHNVITAINTTAAEVLISLRTAKNVTQEQWRTIVWATRVASRGEFRVTFSLIKR